MFQNGQTDFKNLSFGWIMAIGFKLHILQIINYIQILLQWFKLISPDTSSKLFDALKIKK